MLCVRGTDPTPSPRIAKAVVARKRINRRGTKVKTGCTTCRIRKVKCDENKPSCQKCVVTGRTCDGYESPFRDFAGRPIDHARVGNKPRLKAFHPRPPSSIGISAQDVEFLNRCFSTKTVFDIELRCDEEAREVLQASLTDPLIHHAILSLKAFREDFETSGDALSSAAEQTPSYHYGVQQYNMALGGLACKLSSPGFKAVKLALLCCQIFISIEQVRKNYTAMAQHFIRGLRIMRECRARPGFTTVNKLLPAQYHQLPFIDIFVLKLFAAPCKFTDPSAITHSSDTTSSVNPMCPQQYATDSREIRKIVPNMRTELTKIATSTQELLGEVLRVEKIDIALQLLSQREALLKSLESWLTDLELIQAATGCSGPESISVSFLRFFHAVVKVVLYTTLDSSQDLGDGLWTAENRLEDIAQIVAERVKAYETRNGT